MRCVRKRLTVLQTHCISTRQSGHALRYVPYVVLVADVLRFPRQRFSAHERSVSDGLVAHCSRTACDRSDVHWFSSCTW